MSQTTRESNTTHTNRVYGAAPWSGFQKAYARQTNNKGVICDVCHNGIGNGARWKCGTCPDYDLCSGCWKDGKKDAHFQGEHAFTEL